MIIKYDANEQARRLIFSYATFDRRGSGLSLSITVDSRSNP